jgi:GH15 family glucan-1,4-alpha-glucosidase
MGGLPEATRSPYSRTGRTAGPHEGTPATARPAAVTAASEWEVRGPRRHFVHSKIMAWVAADRTVRALEENERLLALCNDVGLLSEEYDPVACRQLGNFPQAFCHIGLVGTALTLFGEEGAG